MLKMPKDRVSNIPGIDHFIDHWGDELRHRTAHDSNGSESGMSDLVFESHILTARRCVTQIRCLPNSDPRAKEIFRELTELEQFLRGELAAGSARVRLDTDSEVRDLAIDAANA